MALKTNKSSVLAVIKFFPKYDQKTPAINGKSNSFSTQSENQH